ncbi:MAG: hydroxymethylbilane synthase [Deltaproteobacteria bacterium]|nr:MAG: hydroxymethylbilane synthase [Deltaproteobacteria bacterium]
MVYEKGIRIGTRGSKLALKQTTWVRDRIAARYPEISLEVVRIRTTGDKITDVPLAKVGGKGLFVKEIEEALLRGEIDLAVHSMKDVPTELPPGLHLGAITERQDPRDVLISRNGRGLRELPSGARIGTSSLRRKAQLLGINPHWEVVPLRGNLDTRIRKLETEGLDAVILAAAGVCRMGLEGEITEYFTPEVMLPAVGQGALGIECRVDAEANELIAFLHHPESAMAVRGERAFLRQLQGGCQVPIAAYGEVRGGKLLLQGMVARLDGSKFFRAEAEGEDPEEVGRRLAEDLLAQGAEKVLREIYSGSKEE